MEITTSNILFNGCNIDSMIFDRMGAEIVYRLLLDMGATKDIKFNWNEETVVTHFEILSLCYFFLPYRMEEFINIGGISA